MPPRRRKSKRFIPNHVDDDGDVFEDETKQPPKSHRVFKQSSRFTKNTIKTTSNDKRKHVDKQNDNMSSSSKNNERKRLIIGSDSEVSLLLFENDIVPEDIFLFLIFFSRNLILNWILI